MANIGIFYGSTTGNTQKAAEKIQALFGKDAADLASIEKASVQDLNRYHDLIFGSSTWGYGELQDGWFSSIDKLNQVDFAAKKVALFGTGDQQGYPDTFRDAVGLLYAKVVANGAAVVGFWPKAGYTHDSSKAEQDGRFVGLALDEDNQSELTDQRIGQWVEGLKAEFK